MMVGLELASIGSKLLQAWFFKYLLVAIVGAACGGYLAYQHLDGKIDDLRERNAALLADNEVLRGQFKAADDQRIITEEQCQGRIEHERNKPKTEINTTSDVDDDYLGRVLGGVRKGDGKDNRKAGSPSKSDAAGTSKAKPR